MTRYYYFNHNFPIDVTDETVEVTPHTFQRNNQIWEIEGIFQFFSQINPHKEYTIADIGAQSGSYSLFAKYLPKSTFYSFEPFDKSFKVLTDNLKLNNIENVIPHKVALSNETGKTILNTSKSHNGFHTLGSTPLRFSDTEPIEVETKTLDSFFYDVNKRLDFIKIDTEGWELNIIKGGMNTIQKYKPIIQLEWVKENMKQCSVSEEELLHVLHTLGYRENMFWSRFNECVEDKIFVPIT
jgi:FkbM family methyltransferase